MNAIEIINEWNAVTAEQQENYCKACVCTALNDRYHLSAGYTFEDATQDTYLRVLEAMQDPEALDADSDKRTTAGKAGNTLSMVINRAARAGLERMAYQSRKHGKANNHQITNEDGEEIDTLYLLAATNDTEKAAIIRVALRGFTESLDEINQKIIAGKIDGLTERELASIVGISNVAVHKRIVKMQKALMEML